jgi:hypothetical protein
MTVVGQHEPVRPACPRHPASRVQLDGYVHCAWSPAHRRPRYRCVTESGSRGHAFSLPVSVRQPTEHHPDSGQACPRCEHVYERHEGVKTGRDLVFGHVEIARLFLRLGEGMSLREASAEVRRSIFRTDGGGDASRAATLAVNYLDAFAPAVIEALVPRTWPAVVVIDSTTLMTRGYRPRRRPNEETDEPAQAGPAEIRAGNLKAGTIMLALDGAHRRPRPCLIQVRPAWPRRLSGSSNTALRRLMRITVEVANGLTHKDNASASSPSSLGPARSVCACTTALTARPAGRRRSQRPLR